MATTTSLPIICLSNEHRHYLQNRYGDIANRVFQVIFQPGLKIAMETFFVIINKHGRCYVHRILGIIHLLLRFRVQHSYQYELCL